MAASEQGDAPPANAPPTDTPMKRGGFSDLAKRTGTAAVLIAVALSAVWAGGPAYTLLIFAVLALLLWEWAEMALPFPDRKDKIIGTAAMTVLLFTTLLFTLPEVLGLEAGKNAPLWVFGLGVVVAWGASFRVRWPREITPGAEPVHASIGDLLNYYKWATWFAPGIVAALWLRHEAPSGTLLLVWLFAVIWAADIGAYAAGRLIGGPKLAPQISPGKTWSGAVGGLVLAVIIGVGVAALAGGADLTRAAWMALLLAFIGMIGDLAQSAFKRASGVKDSGSLLPGHGGVFDRLDSLLAALPLYAVMILAGETPL